MTNKIFKLLNGQTLMAKMIEDVPSLSYIKISDPLLLELILDDEDDKPMHMALNWIPLHKDKEIHLNIQRLHVVTYVDCDEETDSYYEKSVAVLKGDMEKLKRLLQIDDKERYENEDDGKVIHLSRRFLNANTVH